MESANMSDSSWLPEPEFDRTLESNWLFRLHRERFRSRISDKAHDYYVVHLANAVNVIALTPDEDIVFVRQFRAGSRLDSLEIPGGLLEPGEDPLVAGARELLEETGYAGDHPRLVGTAWSNPSIMTSKTTTIVIENVRQVAVPSPDASEELAVGLMPAAELDSLIRDGHIDHALVVLAILWWQTSRG
jgi:8-oxo-dGTP pyrophosphatase MutT (NUDIX family)